MPGATGGVVRHRPEPLPPPAAGDRRRDRVDRARRRRGSAGLRPGYELKLNSYDLGVDIELARRGAAAAVRASRRCRPWSSPAGSTKVFCAGANIRMLAPVDRTAWKVNFCKFTNETRTRIEDATDALRPDLPGGGQRHRRRRRLRAGARVRQIMLVDDGSSAVSLPEVPLLGVLPGHRRAHPAGGQAAACAGPRRRGSPPAARGPRPRPRRPGAWSTRSRRRASWRRDRAPSAAGGGRLVAAVCRRGPASSSPRWTRQRQPTTAISYPTRDRGPRPGGRLVTITGARARGRAAGGRGRACAHWARRSGRWR